MEELRRLAAIMFTDIAGYTALTQRNEALAQELLKEHNEILRPIFIKWRGHEVKSIGDGFLVEFVNVLDSVHCALDIQETLYNRNQSISPNRKFEICIGIHVCDVIYRDNDVFGDGVNIASRVQDLAEPGGICLTEDVVRQIRNKIEVPLVSLGVGELKNIRLEVTLYKILLPWKQKKLSASERARKVFKSKTFLLSAIGVIIISLGLTVLIKMNFINFSAKEIESNLIAQDFNPNTYYRLTTLWQGEDKSLDVLNDGENNKLQLFQTGNYTGQAWKITPLENGYCRLTTSWQGEDKSLGVINGEEYNELRLLKTETNPGQEWKITPLGHGYYRMTTLLQGEGISLDVVNDGKNDKLAMAKTGKYYGQYWLIRSYYLPKSQLVLDLPKNWFKAGNEPQSYEMGIDKGAGQHGKNAATIKSLIEKIVDGFGTLMQNCLSDKYLGKRVCLTGYMKTKDVNEWAGFWMRVDEAKTGKSLSFDNMHDGKQDRSITGTTDWAKYEIVLDVPEQASNIAFGAVLVGTGQIWIDDLKLQVVDNSVPTTGKVGESTMPLKEPANFDFEK